MIPHILMQRCLAEALLKELGQTRHQLEEQLQQELNKPPCEKELETLLNNNHAGGSFEETVDVEYPHSRTARHAIRLHHSGVEVTLMDEIPHQTLEALESHPYQSTMRTLPFLPSGISPHHIAYLTYDKCPMKDYLKSWKDYIQLPVNWMPFWEKSKVRLTEGTQTDPLYDEEVNHRARIRTAAQGRKSDDRANWIDPWGTPLHITFDSLSKLDSGEKHKKGKGGSRERG